MESIQKGVVILSSVALAYFAYKSYLQMEQALNRESQASSEGSKIAKKLKERGADITDLTTHELAVCCDLVFSDDCEVDFSSVAGLDDAKTGLRDVINAFKRQGEMKKGKLLGAPKGVLLYGPPGNGKTLLARAFARECGSNFINMRSSTLFDKYYGESEKYAKAYFSLAKKLNPCVIFIDEVDLLLAKDSGFQASHNKVIGTILSEWDGLNGKGEFN